MARAPIGSAQIFAELKRRRVQQVMAAFLAGSFVVSQLPASLRGPQLPGLTVLFAVLPVLLGYVIYLPLARACDIGPAGIRRAGAVDEILTGAPELLPRGAGGAPRLRSDTPLPLRAAGWLCTGVTSHKPVPARDRHISAQGRIDRCAKRME
jgi:hypothetical protein